MNKYQEAIQKGAAWLAKHQNDDGSISPLELGIGSYYKMPMAFNAAGKSKRAGQLLSWVRAKIIDETGDFSGPYSRGIYDGVYPYPNAWLTVAAHINGFFDISIPAVNFLIGIQSPAGGFYNNKQTITEALVEKKAKSAYQTLNNAETTLDIMCTAMSGLACLYTGKMDAAFKTASLLEKMYLTQPNLDGGFYFHYKPEQGLYCDFKPQEALAYYIDFQAPKQFYFELGIAAVFLIRFAQFSGQQKYSKLAEDYLLLIEKAADDKYTTPQSGKIGWAASYLYNITGQEKYQKMVLAVADYLVAAQDQSGCWYNVSEKEDLQVTTMDVTAEFVVLLNEMLLAL